MQLSLFSIAGLTLSVSCFILTFIILSYSKTLLHKMWILFNITVGLWGLCAFFIGGITDKDIALIVWRFTHIFVAFIPIFMLHVVYILCHLRSRKFLYFAYIQGVIFSILAVASPLFIPRVKFVFNSFYYDVAGPLFFPFFAIWGILVAYVHFKLLVTYFNSTGKLRMQILYLFVGSGVGFSGGITNFLPPFGIDIYPFGNFTIPLYSVIVTYAIVKYRLMDIRVAITRGGIFVFVYTLFLGLPFLLGVKTGHWVGAMVLMGVFASCGPFVYSYLRQRSEEVILREERRYQKALKEFASTLIFIKDVEELTRKVVTRIMDSLNVKFCAIYLGNDNNFCLTYFESKDSLGLPEQVGTDSEFILGLRQARGPLLGEELPPWGERNLGLVVPLFLNQKLFGMILLSEKEKGFFTETDLDVFAILSAQISLALSEIYYLEEYQKVLREKYEVMIEKERLESAFQISEAFRHELGNIINIISLSLANLIFTEKYQPTREDIEETASSIRRSVKRARAIFDAINDYNNNSQSKFRLVKLDNLLRERIARYRKDILEKGINLEVNLEDDIEVLGNDNLGDALEYILAGGIRAISERLPGKKAIYVSLKRDEGVAHLEISDTGGDVTADTLYKGVGIERGKEGGIFYFIARRIIFDHKGSFKIVSFNEGEGTTFIIELPSGKRR